MRGNKVSCHNHFADSKVFLHQFEMKLQVFKDFSFFSQWPSFLPRRPNSSLAQTCSLKITMTDFKLWPLEHYQDFSFNYKGILRLSRFVFTQFLLLVTIATPALSTLISDTVRNCSKYQYNITRTNCNIFYKDNL